MLRQVLETSRRKLSSGYQVGTQPLCKLQDALPLFCFFAFLVLRQTVATIAQPGL